MFTVSTMYITGIQYLQIIIMENRLPSAKCRRQITTSVKVGVTSSAEYVSTFQDEHPIDSFNVATVDSSMYLGKIPAGTY